MDDGTLVVAQPTVEAAPVAWAATVAAAAQSTVSVRRRGSWPGKRLADIVIALVLLLVSLPLLLVLAVAVKVSSRGPVIFWQRRVGRGGRDFPMMKFRTMYTSSEARLLADAELYALFVECGHKIPAALDPRITPVGRVLRRLSLDELPQLLNVLRGHMSIVGPRPVERSQLIRDYGAYEPMYVALRPGLTGLWQVSGRSTVAFPERAELDDRYLRSCGPWTDAKIILRTPLVVFSGLGAD